MTALTAGGERARATLRHLMVRAAALRYSRPPRALPERPRRLLVIRPDHLGDVLFLTPALAHLRRTLPDAHITALVGPWAAPLLAHSPDVDAVETLAFPWFDRRPRRSWLDPYRRLFHGARALRGRFDVALIMRFDHWWGGWLAAEARIPHRVGYATPLLTPFLTHPLPYRPGRHEVAHNLALCGVWGPSAPAAPERHPLHFRPSPADVEALEVLQVPAGSGPLVAVHPGSGAPVKRWLPQKWAALLDHLHQHHGARLVITGSGAERPLAHEIAERTTAPVRLLAGQTTLGQLAALFAQCDLVVGPDCGPLHLAVAVGTPTVHLYGPVDPAQFGPWGPAERHRVVVEPLPCQFCHRLDWPEEHLEDHPCVTGIPLERVLAEVDALLKGQHSPPPETTTSTRG